MGHKQIRLGQLIAPFGPGSIYTDRRGVPHIVCGLDHWHKRERPTELLACDNPKEFQLVEPRLSRLLRISGLKTPADFRAARHSARTGDAPPPNAEIYTPALRFPRWYRHSKTGKLKKFNLETQRIEQAPEGGRWLPVRFVAACGAGHLSEFPWKKWVGCECPGNGDLYLTDRGGSDLGSIRIECRSCPKGSPGQKGRDLSRTTTNPQPELGEVSEFAKAGIACPGERPWLGEEASERCNEMLVGALINQTNLYTPRTVSAILLPDLMQKDDEVLLLRNRIERDPDLAGPAKMLADLSGIAEAASWVSGKLRQIAVQAGEKKVEQALESLLNGSGNIGWTLPQPALPESELLQFRRAEFNILREQVLDPERIPDLRVVHTSVPDSLESWVARVNLVERLGETRAFCGFDRLGTQGGLLDGMPEVAMRQLFKDQPKEKDRWLPAVRVFGEGLYIELREDAIQNWQAARGDQLAARLKLEFIERLQRQQQILTSQRPEADAHNWHWASRFLLVHTLAHVLITQLVFECGYSSASLRERLYVSDDPQAPMAGLLIYTAAGDSEGTLGGLVRLGRPQRLGPVVRRAMNRASWCSADPICSENLGGQGAQLANMAACHSCALLPETSCETINHGLDRAMLLGTPTDRELGFFASMLPDLLHLS